FDHLKTSPSRGEVPFLCLKILAYQGLRFMQNAQITSPPSETDENRIGGGIFCPGQKKRDGKKVSVKFSSFPPYDCTNYINGLVSIGVSTKAERR
ncbi:hypothetical protein, partial [Brevibacillus borstelensis]|uniref:hypothetical protein n=1 Tax=Brevibacillus borstelensis TaxID=45462 RepID=UPI001D0A1E22